MLRRDPRAEQVGHPAGDDARLARTRPGQDQQRAVDVGDRLALGGRQIGEQVHGGWVILVRGVLLPRGDEPAVVSHRASR